MIAGKEVKIFPAKNINAPLVILHTVRGEGETVNQLARKRTATDFSLAAIGNLNWDDEMSPWAISPISPKDTPCTGGADAYLDTLEEQILPRILHYVPSPSFMALAGYSLAGLFAVYAMYRIDAFARIASASGSFWYPKFLDYVQQHEMKCQPNVCIFPWATKKLGQKTKYSNQSRRTLYGWKIIIVNSVYGLSMRRIKGTIFNRQTNVWQRGFVGFCSSALIF